jgi:outer membrane protein
MEATRELTETEAKIASGKGQGAGPGVQSNRVGDAVRSSFVKLKSWAMCGIAAFMVGSGAGASYSESLEDALVRAYRNNPTIRAERARQRATDEQVPQAKSGWRPVVSAEAEADGQWSRSRTTNFSTGKQAYVISQSYPARVNIQLRQFLFRGFKTVEGIKSAEANVAAGRQQLLSVEQDILFKTVQAYMNVIRDRKILNLRRQNVTVLQEQASAAKQRFDVGEVTRTDVAQANARVSQSKSDVASARAQLASSIASYVNLVGRDPGSLSYPKFAHVPISLQSALENAQQVNPNILAAASVEDSARHSVEVVKGDLLPEASLTANVTASEDWNAKGGYRTTSTIGALVQVPIYEGGRIYSGVRQAKQVASQRKIQVIEAIRQVRESVTASWNLLESKRSSSISAREQVSAAELAASGVREEYLVGSRSTIDVLNAQQELLNAKVGLVVAQRDQIVASYQVLGSIGKLTAAHLHLRTNIYDPKHNYNNVKDKWIGLDAETVE